MLACSMRDQALALLRSCCGRMFRNGPDTFCEVYDHQQPLLSPYNSHLVNSYCHASSCVPAYFLRKHYQWS